jgi:thiosulfate/3-mercaptopyruvate sulfurtransferase
MGHPAVHILDGGFGAWLAAGLPLEQGENHPPAPDPPLQAASEPSDIVGIDAVRAAPGAGVQVVDARSARQYTGAETHARRAGHIPGALSMPYTELLGPDDRFLAPEVLAAKLAAAGIDISAPAITHCNGGVSATVVANAIELAGGARPQLYDGSWNEWGNRDDTDVANGS